jgi:hypothetical protein
VCIGRGRRLADRGALAKQRHARNDVVSRTFAERGEVWRALPEHPYKVHVGGSNPLGATKKISVPGAAGGHEMRGHLSPRAFARAARALSMISESALLTM